MENEPKKIFIAATRQNDGKTTVSLGLFQAMLKHFKSVGYMKPVGQQYVVVDDKKIDKDAYLFHETFALNKTSSLKDLSPVAVPKGFTQNYINKPSDLSKKITSAYSKLKKKNDFILFEGTGHAGVGSIFDLSNATVAKLVGSKVIIVTIGGIGKSIDEIMLNIALFEKVGVDVIGVIVNKVKPEKYNKIKKILTKALSRYKIPLLGVIPVDTELTYPTVASLVDELKPTVLSGKNGYQNSLHNFMIGDMLPHDGLEILTPNTLMIVPGNREGLILTAVCENMLRTCNTRLVSGIIFSDGIKPHKKILALLSSTKIPLLLLNEDAFTIATKINNIIFKIQKDESEKIAIAADLVNKHVDIKKILKTL